MFSMNTSTLGGPRKSSFTEYQIFTRGRESKFFPRNIQKFDQKEKINSLEFSTLFEYLIQEQLQYFKIVNNSQKQRFTKIAFQKLLVNHSFEKFSRTLRIQPIKLQYLTIVRAPWPSLNCSYVLSILHDSSPMLFRHPSFRVVHLQDLCNPDNPSGL